MLFSLSCAPIHRRSSLGTVLLAQRLPLACFSREPSLDSPRLIAATGPGRSGFCRNAALAAFACRLRSSGAHPRVFREGLVLSGCRSLQPRHNSGAQRLPLAALFPRAFARLSPPRSHLQVWRSRPNAAFAAFAYCLYLSGRPYPRIFPRGVGPFRMPQPSDRSPCQFQRTPITPYSSAQRLPLAVSSPSLRSILPASHQFKSQLGKLFYAARNFVSAL